MANLVNYPIRAGDKMVIDDGSDGLPVKIVGLSSTPTVLQTAATANGAGVLSPDLSAYDGTLMLEIENGAGTATVTINGGFDAGLATDQDVYTLGLILLATSVATGASTSTKTTNTSRSIVSGAVSVAANTSYLYQIVDAVKFIEAVISAAAGLGAGTQKTGLSVKLYALPL